jgi:predicted DNA-binding transcriptional regulator AlpA
MEESNQKAEQPATRQPIEPLLTAEDVSEWLNIDRRRVYELPVDQIKISPRCVRWRRGDLEALIAKRTLVLGFE